MEASKNYYKIHRSKSNKRKFVTGGKALKSSGEYTPKFCENVLECWFEAKDVYQDDGFQMEPGFMSYKRLWKYTFAESRARKEDSCLKMSSLDCGLG